MGRKGKPTPSVFTLADYMTKGRSEASSFRGTSHPFNKHFSESVTGRSGLLAQEKLSTSFPLSFEEELLKYNRVETDNLQMLGNVPEESGGAVEKLATLASRPFRHLKNGSTS